MSSNTDKAKGNINEAIGKMKHDIGGAVGSQKLQSEGAAQQAKGNVQQAVGNAKDALKHGINKLAEKTNDRI